MTCRPREVSRRRVARLVSPAPRSAPRSSPRWTEVPTGELRELSPHVHEPPRWEACRRPPAGLHSRNRTLASNIGGSDDSSPLRRQPHWLRDRWGKTVHKFLPVARLHDPRVFHPVSPERTSDSSTNLGSTMLNSRTAGRGPVRLGSSRRRRGGASSTPRASRDRARARVRRRG